MRWLRERLEIIHNIRKEIKKMDRNSDLFEETLQKSRINYPTSSNQYQLNNRTYMVKQASYNPSLALFMNNSLVEKRRAI